MGKVLMNSEYQTPHPDPLICNTRHDDYILLIEIGKSTHYNTHTCVRHIIILIHVSDI